MRSLEIDIRVFEKMLLYFFIQTPLLWKFQRILPI